MNDRRVRVLVIDDSAVIRQLLAEMLSRDPGIEVVGTAADPLIAQQKIQRLKPDVLTLDVEMPRMNGLDFLKQLMRTTPLPVVMVSAQTDRGAAATFTALALGAVDVVAKPAAANLREFECSATEIAHKVRQAALAKVQLRTSPPTPLQASTLSADADTPAAPSMRLVAIGASAGGTEAIRRVLEAMPVNSPPVMIVQHIPPAFSRSFIARLGRHSAIRVVEAQDGAQLLPGHAYLPPPERHLGLVRKRSGAWTCVVIDGDPVNHHRPSVDVLFESVARWAGPDAVGVLLTGMGADGARGLLAMRQAGAATVVQDEATSVVWGMPGAAVRMGAAETVLPLERITERVLELAGRTADVHTPPCARVKKRRPAV
ncbi:protein-glutamate methylesterase/protein-glutamine glutaminase [Luteimonas sp. A478]